MDDVGDIAEKCVDLIESKSGRKLKACDTAAAPLPGGATGRFAAFVEGANERAVKR